jgi:hypothetical protein
MESQVKSVTASLPLPPGEVPPQAAERENNLTNK